MFYECCTVPYFHERGWMFLVCVESQCQQPERVLQDASGGNKAGDRGNKPMGALWQPQWTKLATNALGALW